jgi:hypothetical protein
LGSRVASPALDGLRLGEYRGLGDLPLVEVDVGLLGALEQPLDALDSGLVELVSNGSIIMPPIG